MTQTTKNLENTPAFSLLRVAGNGDSEVLHSAERIGHLHRWAERNLNPSHLSRAFYMLRDNRSGEWFDTPKLDAIVEDSKNADYWAASDPNRAVWG